MHSEEKEVKKGFDLTVTHRDQKSGAVTHTTPYTLRVVAAADGGRTSIWERPANSGNIFDKKGVPSGRWVKDKNGKGKYDPEAAHIAYVPPETNDQKLAREMVEKDARIAALEKELAEISAANEPKVPAKASKIKE